MIATFTPVVAASGSAVGLLFLVVLAACVFGWFKLRSGETLRFETTAPSSQMVMTATSVVGTKRRWAVLAQTDNSVTFAYHKGPNKLLAVILFFFFIIPCIVYLILAGKKESLSVAASSLDGRQTLVQVTSNGWRGKSAGRALRAQLGVAAGTSAATAGAR